MFQTNDYVGIVANSNCLHINDQNKIDNLIKVLNNMNLYVICSPYLYQSDMVKKAQFMMELYQNQNVKAIFDVSGGDLANEVIAQLDYEIIQMNPKPLFGYSDLTCLLNALYTKTKKEQYLYQVKNLIFHDYENQQNHFYQSLFQNKNTLFDFDYHFIKGNEMKGIVVGGNIRCFLKLAGTPYFPDMTNKILFLESLGGHSELMHSHLVHLQLLGVFEQISGIILGTFTTMEQNHDQPTIESMIVEMIKDTNISLVKTQDIGHSDHSKALVIGRYLELKK